MDQGPEIQEYKAGDTVRIEMDVEHDFELKEVRGLWQHERAKSLVGHEDDKGFKIGFEGRVTRKKSDTIRTPPNAVSTVVVVGKVRADNVPGIYLCSGISATHQPSGREIRFDVSPPANARFTVVEEPIESPRATQARFVS